MDAQCDTSIRRTHSDQRWPKWSTGRLRACRTVLPRVKIRSARFVSLRVWSPVGNPIRSAHAKNGFLPLGVVRRCKDCATTARAAPHPGPRCASHHRIKRQATREAAHARHLARMYNMSPDRYQRLYEAQGRHCATCPATGKARLLAVDHDHSCCPGRVSCGRCVRGLLCSFCNKTLGHHRDRPEAFEAMADYLRHPPAYAVA